MLTITLVSPLPIRTIGSWRTIAMDWVTRKAFSLSGSSGTSGITLSIGCLRFYATVSA